MKDAKRFMTSNGCMVLVLVVAVITMMLAPTALASETKIYKGRLSYHWAPKHYSAIMASKFAEECKKATNGRLDIEVFPSGQLYSIAQIVPALSQGSVDLGGVLGVLFMRVNKNFFLSGMMRFFDSFQQKRDFWEKTPEGQQQWEGLQKKLGIKILAYIPVGPTCYFSTERTGLSVCCCFLDQVSDGRIRCPRVGVEARQVPGGQVRPSPHGFCRRGRPPSCAFFAGRPHIR